MSFFAPRTTASRALRMFSELRADTAPIRIPRRKIAPSPFQPSCSLRARGYSTHQTPQQIKDRAAFGPFTWRAGVLFLITGGGLYWYFESEKQAIQEKRRQEHATTGIGRPNIGGPFRLMTTDKEPREFTEQDILGRWTMIYAGFSNCPDICPMELDKLGDVVNETDKLTGKELIQPLFITCDPARDTIPVLRNYLTDFHPRLLGLTGSYAAIKQACKSYRIYFSTPPDSKPDEDYLVDHSIFIYLMNPKGQFEAAYGQNTDTEGMVKGVMEIVGRWNETH